MSHDSFDLDEMLKEAFRPSEKNTVAYCHYLRERIETHCKVIAVAAKAMDAING